MRDAGLDERIYLLGGFLAEQADAIVALDVTPAVFDLSLIAPLDAAARLQAKTGFPVHFELDTGATRLGILPGEVGAALELIRQSTALRLKGVGDAARQRRRSVKPGDRSATAAIQRNRRVYPVRRLRAAGKSRGRLRPQSCSGLTRI